MNLYVLGGCFGERGHFRDLRGAAREYVESEFRAECLGFRLALHATPPTVRKEPVDR